MRNGEMGNKEVNRVFVALGILGVWAVCVLAGGCASQECCGARYADPGEIVAGAPESPTMYDIESSVHALMEKMLASQAFSRNYGETKASKDGRLPVVVVGNIDNRTTERIQGRLDAAGETVRTALFDCGLFEVKDDDAADAIKSRIVRGVDGGLENGSLVGVMGAQDSPDFIVLGDFRHFEDVGGVHTYRMRLAIHSLTTGKIVWEGVKTSVKL